MIWKNKGKVAWLEFELFAPYSELTVAVFLRQGGVSVGGYHSLNAGGGADSQENIFKNRAIIRETLGCESFSICGQPHRDRLVLIPEDTKKFLDDSDGMMTDRLNQPLLIKHADCQAAVFYDPKHKAVANVHAGWRGQVKNIYQQTVEKMKTTFGSNPSEILVSVSPSLGPAHSEFIHYENEWPKPCWKFQICPSYFDLWAIGKYQLIQSGILQEHIQFAEICTFSNPENFYSYRREKPTGSHATVVNLHQSSSN